MRPKIMNITRAFLMCLVVTLTHCFGEPVESAKRAPGPPTGLMCELLSEPEAALITDPQPEFTWIVNDARAAAVQTACQIQVSTSEESLRAGKPDLWDSGKVVSNQSVAVEYRGPALRPFSCYWWRVRTWDGAGRPSPYSRPQQFRTGQFQAKRVWPGESQWVQPPETSCLSPGWWIENRRPVSFHRIPPTRVVRKAEGRYFIDFGRAAYATLLLTLESVSSDPVVEIHLSEKLSAADTVDRKPPGTIRYHHTKLAVQPGKKEYMIELPRQAYGVRMPDHLPEVLPFRYCEIINSPSPLDRSSVAQWAAWYPFQDDASHFESSSEVLNQIWELCKYSIKATTALGIYIDGDRERTPYEADAYINQLGHYSVDREYALARYSHEYLMFHPTWPTEWILHSILMAWADYLYTGDTESLHRYYDDLLAKSLRDLAREDGLVSSSRVTPKVLEAIHLGAGFRVGPRGFRDIVDWPPGETDGFEFRETNAVVNAFYYQAMRLMSRIAAAVGKPEESREFAERADKVYASFNKTFLDPETGLYLDGEGSRHSSQHANMFALAFGLVPGERKQRVVEFIKSREMACSVYGAQYLLDALYEAGEADHALRLMTDEATDRSWPHMMEVGTTITLEAWDEKYKPNLDWNHAWGAAPANIIPRRLMGIEPVEPGFARVRIRPQPGFLDTASVRMPTVRGEIAVDYRRDGSTRRLSVRLPANCSGDVELPDGRTVPISSGVSTFRY